MRVQAARRGVNVPPLPGRRAGRRGAGVLVRVRFERSGAARGAEVVRGAVVLDVQSGPAQVRQRHDVLTVVPAGGECAPPAGRLGPAWRCDVMRTGSCDDPTTPTGEAGSTEAFTEREPGHTLAANPLL